MKPILKIAIRVFLITGLIFAGLMAGFDYAEGIEFRTWKFVINTIFFGGLMSLLAVYSHKKKMKKNNNDNK